MRKFIFMLLMMGGSPVIFAATAAQTPTQICFTELKKVSKEGAPYVAIGANQLVLIGQNGSTSIYSARGFNTINGLRCESDSRKNLKDGLQHLLRELRQRRPATDMYFPNRLRRALSVCKHNVPEWSAILSEENAKLDTKVKISPVDQPRPQPRQNK